MNNLDNLKAIWHTAKTDNLPTSKEVMRLIGKFRSQKLRNKWLVIILSLLLFAVIVAVLYIVPFKMATTYAGGAMMALSSLLLAGTNFRSLKRFNQLEDCSNLDFLAFIEQTRKNQIFYYKRTMVTIISLCAVGWLLYLYEVTYQHPLWCIGIYSAAAIYLAVMWFIVRPRAFKRDTEKLNATRERFENILKQLKSYETS